MLSYSTDSEFAFFYLHWLTIFHGKFRYKIYSWINSLWENIIFNFLICSKWDEICICRIYDVYKCEAKWLVENSLHIPLNRATKPETDGNIKCRSCFCNWTVSDSDNIVAIHWFSVAAENANIVSNSCCALLDRIN